METMDLQNLNIGSLVPKKKKNFGSLLSDKLQDKIITFIYAFVGPVISMKPHLNQG